MMGNNRRKRSNPNTSRKISNGVRSFRFG